MDIKFECTIYYLGSYSIKWTYNDKNLPKNADYINTFLVLKSAQEKNSGIYSCEVITGKGMGIGKASGKLKVVGKFSIV